MLLKCKTLWKAAHSFLLRNLSSVLVKGKYIFQEEEKAQAEVYQEFVASFEDASKGVNKTWVKGGLVNSDKTKIGIIVISS